MINLKSKKLKYGAAAVAVTLIIVAVTVLLNVIVYMLGNRYNLKVDLTQDGIFDISELSKDYLRELNQDVEIAVMIEEAELMTSSNIYIKHGYEVLRKYALNSERIKLTFTDLTKNPDVIERYRDIYAGQISPEDIIISSGESRVKVISLMDLYEREVNMWTGRPERIIASQAEQTITSAIMYVTDINPVKAVILDVEPPTMEVLRITGNIYTLLEANGYEMEVTDPLQEPIPDDADLIVLNAPLNDFPEFIVDRIYDYMENGGKLGKNMIYLANFNQNPVDNIEAFLSEWGIVLERSVVSESNLNNRAAPEVPFAIMNYIEESRFSENIVQPSLPFISFASRPLFLRFEAFGNVETQSLLQSSDTSYIDGEFYDSAQPEGPYSLIALANKYAFVSNERVDSHLLVFGSAQMLDPDLTNAPFYNNGDYFISIVNEMTGKTGSISIVPKNLSPEIFHAELPHYKTLRSIYLNILPLSVLACGVVVWLRRRHR